MQSLSRSIIALWTELEGKYLVGLADPKPTKIAERVESFRDEIALRSRHERSLDQYLLDVFEHEDKKPCYSKRTQLSVFLAGSFYGSFTGAIPHIPRLEDEPNYRDIDDVEYFARASFLATGFLPDLQSISVHGKVADQEDFSFNPLQSQDSLHMINAQPAEYSQHLYSKVQELFSHLGNHTSQPWLLLLEPNTQRYAMVLKHMYVIHGILPPDEVKEE